MTAVLMQHTVTAQVAHIIIDIAERHVFDEIEIDIHNVDFAELAALERRITDLLEIAEKIPHVEEVFIDGVLRVRFDGFVVRQKVPQNRRRFGAIIDHSNQLLIKMRHYSKTSPSQTYHLYVCQYTKTAKKESSLKPLVMRCLNSIIFLFSRNRCKQYTDFVKITFYYTVFTKIVSEYTDFTKIVFLHKYE